MRPGSALDRDALLRGNSVYFPDRVVPMLPERISNDLCSLVPGEARGALAVRMVIGADGRKRSHSFHRVLMRSAAKLNYAQVQDAIDGRPDDATSPLLDPVLRPVEAGLYWTFGVDRSKQQTWLAYGGGQYASSANLASASQQVAVAQRVLAGQGIGAGGQHDLIADPHEQPGLLGGGDRPQVEAEVA